MMKKQILVLVIGLYSLLLTSHTASGQQLPNYAIDLSNTNWTYNQLTSELTINTRILNDGQASSAASRIGFYVSEHDAVIRTQDSFIGSVSIGSLAAGSFSDHTFTVRLDQIDGQRPFNKAGDFYAGFKVDDWGMVAELQEMDNRWSTETKITYQPGGEGQIFTRITNDESVQNVRGSVAVSWIDYDDDGDLDLFVSNGEPNDKNDLFRNNGSGSFTRVNSGDIVNDTDVSFGHTWGDYDNDGYPDLYIANKDDRDNFLYKNNGSGTFSKLSSNPAVVDAGWSLCACWGDMDNDGDLDLFVANDKDQNNFLYENVGSGNFQRINPNGVFSDGGFSTSCSWADIDNDLDLDLFVTNWGQNNALYRNNGNRTFAKVSSGPVVNDLAHSFGASWADFDNDGDLDLFVANDGNEFLSIGEDNFLYKNDGSGSFTQINQGPVVNDNGLSHGNAWGDFDNDGDLDLFVANKGNNDNFLYENNGSGNFSRVSGEPVVSNKGNSFGSAWADIDGDGDLDLYIANRDEVNFLYKNNGNSNHWLHINCVGRISNTQAIGAVVRVKAGINGQAVWQMQQISAQTGGGYGGQNSLTAEFGLGDATVVDSIEVTWPSGGVQVLINIAADQMITIIENRPPTIANQIPDQELTEGGASFVRDLNADPIIFSDPDSDPLSYSASSSNVNSVTTDVSGSVLTLTPLLPGNSTILVVADDNRGGRDSTSFNVTVVSANRRPAVLNIIPNQSVFEGDSSFVRNLEDDPVVFTDPDGDALSYSAISSDTNVVTTDVSGSVLTVMPISAGTATILVIADDSNGGLDSTSFSFTVVPVGQNLPPTVQNIIPDQELTEGGASFLRDLNADPIIFSDPNGDELTYQSFSSQTAVASVALDGSVLSVTPLVAGNTAIKVVADDGNGGSDSTSFAVMIKPPNNAPTVLNAIQDVTLRAKGQAFMRNLNADPAVFSDPDNDVLFYSISADSSIIANAIIIEDTVLVVEPLMVGATTIRLTASDPFQAIAKTSFLMTVVMNQLPSIDHAPPVETEVAQNILITAIITDDFSVTSAILEFRRGGNAVFAPTMMLPAGTNEYSATIPASEVTDSGVEYRLKATDTDGAVTVLPESNFFSLRTRISDQRGILKGQAQPGGLATNAYRLISVPVDLDNKDPAAVLEDDLGSYDLGEWRFYDVGSDENLRELPNTAPMAPGRGFWLIVRDAGKRIGTGPGRSMRTDVDFSAPLHSGWNLIGNPFNFPIPVTQITLNGEVAELRAFNGNWNNPETAPVLSMLGFEAYAIFNNSLGNALATISPITRTGAQVVKTSSSISSDLEWFITITAKSNDATDRDNLLGVSRNLSDGFDHRDRPEPPVIGDYVSVYFTHAEWQQVAKKYCTDFRREISEGQIWKFEIKTNILDVVNLTFEGLQEVPAEYNVWLLDEALNISQNLRERNACSVAASLEHPKRLKLLVGSSEFVDEQVVGKASVPETFELSQNFPNPFNPMTTIRFGLPQEERVSLKIFNILGEEVVSLLNDELQSAGYHVVVWDGRNSNGPRVSSGVYLYQVRFGDTVLIKKMALVR